LLSSGQSQGSQKQLKNEKRRAEMGVAKLLELGELSGFDESMGILPSIYLGAECGAGFIGSFSSGLSRTIFKMMIATQNRVPPHFSYDSWANDQNGLPESWELQQEYSFGPDSSVVS